MKRFIRCGRDGCPHQFKGKVEVIDLLHSVEAREDELVDGDRIEFQSDLNLSFGDGALSPSD